MTIRLLWLLKLIVAVVSLVSDASGQVCSAKFNKVGSSGFGSAFAIGTTRDGSWFFLTAGHCLQGAQDAYIDIGGEYRRATIQGWVVNNSLDIGAMTLKYDGNVTAYPLLQDNPPLGTIATFYGYGGGKFRAVESQVIRHGFGDGRVLLDRPSVPGDSGGPVIVGGKVAGVVVMTDDSRCYATSPRAVHRWLEQLQNPTAAPPEQYAGVGIGANIGGLGMGVGIGGWDCRSGQCRPRYYQPYQPPPQYIPPPQQPQGPSLPPPSQPDPFVEPNPPTQPEARPEPPAPSVDIALIIRSEIQALAASGALKGEPGRDGLDGKDGARGPQGLPGPKGADGEFDTTAVLALNAKIAALQAQLNDLKPTNTAPLVAEIVELKEKIAHLEGQTITLEIQSAGRVVGESESGKLGDAGKRKIRFDVEEITQPNR